MPFIYMLLVCVDQASFTDLSSTLAVFVSQLIQWRVDMQRQNIRKNKIEYIYALYNAFYKLSHYAKI